MGRSLAFRSVQVSALLTAFFFLSSIAAAAKPDKENAEKSKAADTTHVDISAGILAGETPAVVRIEKALDEPTEIDCAESPLCDLVNFLQTRHKIEIVLDHRGLEEAGVATDTPITDHLKDVSLRAALNLLLRNLELTYLIRDDVLLITTVAQADTIMTVRIYPVEDLLNHLNQEVVDLRPAESLIDVLTATVAPTTWTEVGGAGSIKFLSSANSLVVAQTYAGHQEVRDTLTALRRIQALERGHASAENPNRVVVAIYRLSSLAVTHHAIAAATNAENATDDKTQPAPKVERKVEASNRGLADQLAQAIPKIIEPSSWQSMGGQGTIESFGVGVIVRQTPRVQREIARLMSAIETRFPSGMGMSGVGSF